MKRLLKSFEWASHGIHTVWKEETNFRIEFYIGVAVVALAWYVGFSTIEWAAIFLCIGVVLASEMVNTAVEDLCDRIEPSHDPIIGKIKDVMGGFVLVVSLTSATVGILIFSGHI